MSRPVLCPYLPAGTALSRYLMVLGAGKNDTWTELTLAERLAPMACDQPRGARFTLVACDGPMILNRPAAWPSYS